jgi:two-component SAPR family response regulator
MSQRQLSPVFSEKSIYNITTLGNFQVICNGNDLTDALSKSLKVWELFKYLLTFRDDLILPEKIIQSLWPEADYVDPKRTLRALIFRLRKALELEECSESDSLIVSSRGCYKFETRECCTIDVVLFENLFRSACEAARYDTEKAIDLFGQAVEMYKGDYLSETYGHDWLIPARNYYRRIFLQSVYEACEMLKEQKRYQEITGFCEAAFKHELYEEELHLFYIEALAGTGKLKQARSHYEYVKDLFERELGVQPSSVLTKVYRMLFGEISRTGLDMNYIKDNLKEETIPNGPLLCDRDFFKALQQLESRRAERYGPRNFLGLLTLTLPDHTLPGQGKLEEGMKQLRHLLLSDLRKGDVITEWGEAQFLLSLPAISDKQAEIALTRIQKKILRVKQRLWYSA